MALGGARDSFGENGGRSGGGGVDGNDGGGGGRRLGCGLAGSDRPPGVAAGCEGV